MCDQLISNPCSTFKPIEIDGFKIMFG